MSRTRQQQKSRGEHQLNHMGNEAYMYSPDSDEKQKS